MKESVGNLKKGEFVNYRESIWQIVNKSFSFQGRGLANVKLKLKNILENKSIELTIKSGQELEVIDISSVKMNYLYQDNAFIYFIDDSFEQFSISKKNIGDFSHYLIEGEKYFVIMHANSAVNLKLPEKVTLKVVEAPNAVKGDTTTSAKKIVKTQTGLKLLVPLFIKQGDQISVNPQTGEYIERKNS
ncbi:MAG: elongation factor P [bacterium]